MARESRFLDLRRLADWLVVVGRVGACESPRALAIERVITRLGASCVPLLGRTMRVADEPGRVAAREGLAFVASLDDRSRARVVAELKDIARGASSDDGKLSAIGLLADLGASIRSAGIARFADPAAVQRRSAAALAAQLETAADVAKAADLMIGELPTGDALHMLLVMAEVAPAVAERLVIELRARLDLPDELRDEIPVVPACPPDDAPRRLPRPTHATVLVDEASRVVVIATRKVIGARRWRRWAVLIGPTGRLDDSLHEEDATEDADALVAGLTADGYRIASRDHDDARDAVAAAARLSASTLTPAYYLGRDLLDLGNAHLSSAAPLDRAVELLAAGDPAGASALLAELAPRDGRSDRIRAVLGDVPSAADIAAATAACLLAQDRPADAIDWLARAIAIEPDWPLHHWNLAVALHRAGGSAERSEAGAGGRGWLAPDAERSEAYPGGSAERSEAGAGGRGWLAPDAERSEAYPGEPAACFDALACFLATSAAPTGLAGDPDQPGRIACAERMLVELERVSRLRGIALHRRATRRRRKRR